MADTPIIVLNNGVEQWNQWRIENHHKPCSLARQNLSRGYFYEADFRGVDLSDANLSGACLIGANLQGANLSGANLSDAYVDDANFRKANLIGANLTGTDIQKADLREALLPAAYDQTAYNQPMPERGKELASVQAETPQAEAQFATTASGPTGVAIAPKEIHVLSGSVGEHSKGDGPSESSARKFKKRLVVWMPASAMAAITAITTISLIPNGLLTPSFTAATNRETPVDTVEEVSNERIDKSTLNDRFKAEAGTASQSAVEQLSLVNALPGASQVWAVATHIRPDGQIWVMSGNADGQIKIWDGRTGETLHTLAEHNDTIRTLAVSSTGDRLVSGSGDGIKVWQPETGELLYELPAEAGSPVWSVAISSDNRTFISGDYSGNITAWDMETGEQQYTTNVKAPVWSVAIAPDSQSFVSGSSDRTIRQWDLANGRLLQEFSGHEDDVRAVAISADGETIASGSWDSTIKLWDLDSGELKTTLRGHSDRVVSLAISPDSNTLASSSVDNTLKMWDIPSQQLINTLDNSDNWVLTVAFDLKEGTLVSGGKDQTIKLWQ
ncbi:MAG: pentapeptide repeat-containing protein [Cyanobacteria bacterium J06560_6]